MRGAGAQEGEGPDHVGQLLGLEAVPVAQAVQADGLQQLRARVVEQPREAPHAVGCVLRGNRVQSAHLTPSAWARLEKPQAARCKSETCAKSHHALKPTPTRMRFRSGVEA